MHLRKPIGRHFLFCLLPLLLAGAAAPAIEQHASQGFFEVELRIDRDTLHMAGNRKADVILLEFSDYRCPSCIKFNMTVKPLLRQEYVTPGKIAYAFVDAPLSTTDRGILLARAAFCAGQQGRFWELHDWLFLHPALSGNGAVDRAVEELALDRDPFSACLSDEASKQAVLASQEIAGNLGVSATPVFFVGWRISDDLYRGKWIRGAEHYFVYRYLIEKALEHASLRTPKGGEGER